MSRATDNSVALAMLKDRIAALEAENARLLEVFSHAPASADFATLNCFSTAYDEWWEASVEPALR